MGQKIMKIVVEMLRIVVGAVFAFSGFVKAIDPIGSAYKIQDYFIAFGLTELFPLALPGAVFMVSAELVLGILLLLGIFRKITIVFIALFMVFFTPLTLWVAMNNPVADCGCFGDAFVITNWQSFSKNVVLLLSSVFLLFKFEHITPLFSKKIAKFVAIFVIVFSTLFSFYNLHREPVLDFRPYRIGVNIPESMRVNPENLSVYEAILIYRKDGEYHEFTESEFAESEFLWNDPAWEFVDTRIRLVQAGERPAIEHFVIESLVFDEATDVWLFDEDITNEILSEPNYSFLMISHSLDRMRTRQLRYFEAINRYAQERGYSFYLLTASPLNIIGEWERRHQTGFRIIHGGDQRAVHTIMRTNPGLMLLQEGTIINKWAGSEVRNVSGLTVPLNETNFVVVKDEKRRNAMRLLLIGLLLLVPLAIFKWID